VCVADRRTTGIYAAPAQPQMAPVQAAPQAVVASAYAPPVAAVASAPAQFGKPDVGGAAAAEAANLEAAVEAANARAEARRAQNLSAQFNTTAPGSTATDDSDDDEDPPDQQRLPPGSMADDLASALQGAKLSQYEHALRELGCADAADLAEVDEAELLELGMKKIEVKRLMRLLQ
jgi:hypothetical protein